MDHLTITRIAPDLPITSLDDARWQTVQPVSIEKYWSGPAAPTGRHASARLLWSDTALNVRFEAIQTEPLVTSKTPDLSKKTLGLWNRDVCEIFIAPDKANPNKYFEFEIAPTGEWVDLDIEVTPGGRETDEEYSSGMTSAVRVEDDRIVMAIKLPFAAFGKTPSEGDMWLGNLFRCVGEDPTRGYLAWRPTRTEKPNFHVPEAFGEFRFA